MTDEDIMAKISTSYVKTICHFYGYTTCSPESDYGVDIQICEIKRRIKSDGKVRYFDTNRFLGVQMKATHENSTLIQVHENHLTYKLSVKNYNDLVHTKDTGNSTVLILFVLPEEKNDWIKLTDQQLEIRKISYWFKVSPDCQVSENTKTVTISIPLSQKFDSQAISSLFKEQYGI